MDHSATTPVDPRVFEAMKPYYTCEFGNASSVHRKGQAARKAVETGREQIAALINANPQEIVFTSGGTESDNQAIITFALNNGKQGKHLITSAIEHHAVLESFHYLERCGYDVTILPVNAQGMVEPETLAGAIRPDTILVSVMHANNEIGTVQPIEELAAISHKAGAVFHTDAVQTVGKLPIDVRRMGIDMLSASSHKLYGPKGIGCLYVKKGVRISNLLYGGGQESKLRAGTENVPGIVGLGKAAEIAGQEMQQRADLLTRLGKRLREGIINSIPNAIFTGHPDQRVPGSVSVCFQFADGEPILLMLDSYGIMASSGSACVCGALDPSPVLLAIGLPHEIARGSLRLTLGKDNTEEDVDYTLEVLPKLIANLRRM
jgi:cysteine desulfurase